MVNSVRFFAALVATNLKANFALRGAFWVQFAFMVANNLIFFIMWGIFFGRFEEVRGWRLADMAALFGIASGGFGLGVIFAAGSRDLARVILEGDLDTFLTQPKHPLLHCIASRSNPSGWGDFASAYIFLAMSGYLTVPTFVLSLVAMACGGTVLISSIVIIQCMAFWVPNSTTLTKQIAEFLNLFSAFPKTVFSGSLKVVLYTVLPAGFISYLPVELVRDFSARDLLYVVGATVAYVAIAFWVFHRGLRRYESGNRFGVRA